MTPHQTVAMIKLMDIEDVLEINEDLRLHIFGQHSPSLQANLSGGRCVSIRADGTEYWYNDKGSFHRDDGPAIIYKKDHRRTGVASYFLDGKEVSREEHLRYQRDLPGRCK